MLFFLNMGVRVGEIEGWGVILHLSDSSSQYKRCLSGDERRNSHASGQVQSRLSDLESYQL